MKQKTKGQTEAEISEAVIKFEKEFMGRGPLETKSYIIGDMVLVRLKNVLTQAELKLADMHEHKDGRELVNGPDRLLEQAGPAGGSGGKILGSKSKPAYRHQYSHG